MELCNQKIGSLVEFESATEEQLLLEYLRGKYEDTFSFWIGLRDDREENSFTWETSGRVVGGDNAEPITPAHNLTRRRI